MGNSLTGIGEKTSSPVSETSLNEKRVGFLGSKSANSRYSKSRLFIILPFTNDHSEKIIYSLLSIFFKVSASPCKIFRLCTNRILFLNSSYFYSYIFLYIHH